MAETPCLETEVLLAVTNDDEQRALELLAEATLSELTVLFRHASTLAELAAPDNRCPRCTRYVPPTESVTIGLGGSCRRWHRACDHARLEERAVACDRYAWAVLNIHRVRRGEAP
jgi:hypothetical protein